MGSSAAFDLFISYRHKIGDGPEQRTPEVSALAKQLGKGGLSVFIDETVIEVFEGFTPKVEEGIENSKALLVYFSSDYTKSQACMAELRAMYIAAIQNGWDPRERIFTINPESNCDHFHELPVDLRDVNAALTTESAVEPLPKRINNLDGTFGRRGLRKRPLHHPSRSQPTGYERFVGRNKEMWEVHRFLNASEYSQTTGKAGYPDIAQVIGMGGVGKSLLAEEYALRFGAAYPGGVFWLRAHGSYDPKAPDIKSFLVFCREQLRVIAESLGLRLPQDTTLEGFQHSISQKIEEDGRRCLWVVDDIPFGLAEHVNAVKSWLSPHPLARTLTTTRSREYKGLGGELLLDVLDDEKAKDLLKSHKIDIVSQEKDTKDLLKSLGGHSLALDIAGAAIKENGGHIRQFLDEIKKDNIDLIDASTELAGALPAGHKSSIVKTFKHSIDRLDEPGKDLLRIAANLSPEPIRDEFIELVFRNADSLDNKTSKRKCNVALRQADQSSLINRHGQVFDVHALISASVQYLNLATNGRGQALLNSTVQQLLSTIKADATYEEASTIAPDIVHARFLIMPVNEDSEPEVFSLLVRLAEFNTNRGNVYLAVKNWRQVVKIWEETLGYEHPDTLASMNNLALRLYAMGDLKGAGKLEEEVLEKRRRILGPEHPSTLTSMNNLALTLRDMGDLKGAEKLQEEVLEKRRRILGPERPDTLIGMNNLALTLRAMGDLKGAEKLQEEVLEKSRRILGPEHPDTLMGMNNLAVTLRAMGNLKGAEKLQEEVLEKSRRILGPEHPSTLTSMNNLAVTLHAMGDLKGAGKLQEEVLEKRRRILGPEHPDTTNSAWSLFVSLDESKSYEEARRVLQNELIWLLEEGLVLHDERQIQIREMLKESKADYQ